jgi:hypothetical protein
MKSQSTALTLVLMSALILFGSPNAYAQTCTYQTYKWNVEAKRAVERQSISKPYSSLEASERDPVTGCSVCDEDQRAVTLANGVSFKICHIIAKPITDTLNQALEEGGHIETVTAYRVGMTRGDVDENGNRTRFSNHAYGTAIDINPQNNGLYENCKSFGPQCRLRKGGAWTPHLEHGHSRNSPVVISLKEIHWRWGGEIEGRQKDFMHFSMSGY